MPSATPTTPQHTWHFRRAGGFDQVRLDSPADLLHLPELDQKLWVALACPTRGLEFDSKTLDLIDTDHDGRIRVPEILAAVHWACSVLKEPAELLKPVADLPLTALNDASPEGRQLLASAKQVLANLGKPEAATISPEDTADPVRIFAQTRFNGDGIVPAEEAADDPAVQSVLTDIIATLGPETDRSGKPGVNQAKTDAFFAQAQAYSDWAAKAETTDAALLPAGPNTAAAFAALLGVKPKIDDYFARCRLAAFDPRALVAVNRQESEYLALAAKDLTITAAEIAAFPLARIAPAKPLPLPDAAGHDPAEALNPAWAPALAAFAAQTVKPILGPRPALSDSQWSALKSKFAAYEAWLAAKPAPAVEKLGLPRLRAILASPAQQAITDLIAKDKALEPEANAMAAVDRLVRYNRDLVKLLRNFVSFRDFYGRKDKAVFQAGTLYLDQRSCDLCVRVDDPAKHGTMAHLAYTYLAYCDLTRKTSSEKMTIAAAFTAGDSDNLMVGRNGVFYDRLGFDWDATITKIVEHPISIRQAFWAPYKRVARMISDMIAKRAAAADAAAQSRLQAAAAESAQVARTGVAPPPPPPSARVDVGVVAALGVAIGGLTTAFGYFLTWLTAVPKYYLPFYILVLLLLISTPSIILAALKLRQRNLGPILDANGWAVNAKARINIPFGGSLTTVAKLPPGAHRDLVDPYAESHTTRNRIITLILILLALLGLWYFGALEPLREWIGFPPRSAFVIQRDERLAIRLLTEAQTALDKPDPATAKTALTELARLKREGRLTPALLADLDKLQPTPATAPKIP